ncbi:hypothetical protein LJC64_03880 [Ruminococcaceae bacterium OttesenSCG-928-A11]|nr:hypothetical protein [Ruminococcaceae bacterium OttesenSCG-928-A11]
MAIDFDRKIGGLFPLESLPPQENGLFDSLCRPGDDLRHVMSGRCGIMMAIEDFMPGDTKRVAYLPAYTCETVSGCFVKSGYDVLYYDVDRQLRPLYDEVALESISLLLVCGYYGFATFDPAFAEACRARGIGVICDATHSLFTEGGVPAAAHYVAGSLRKWLGVPCGGFAIKRGRAFAKEPTPLHDTHLRHRYRCFALTEKAMAERDEVLLEQASAAFWDAEMLLRDIYGTQGSDEQSIEIFTHYPVEELAEKRRANYAALLAAFPQNNLMRPVLDSLPVGTCPSHFTVYTERRDQVQAALKARDIGSSVYWPVPPFIDIEGYPGAKWVYEHVFSLPCDQRYAPSDMRRIAAAIIDITTELEGTQEAPLCGSTY